MKLVSTQGITIYIYKKTILFTAFTVLNLSDNLIFRKIEKKLNLGQFTMNKYVRAPRKFKHFSVLIGTLALDQDEKF